MPKAEDKDHRCADFRGRVRSALALGWLENPWTLKGVLAKQASAVLFLLDCDNRPSFNGRLCLVLSKRSTRVTQAGDLCCPGGRVNKLADGLLAWAISGQAAIQNIAAGRRGGLAPAAGGKSLCQTGRRRAESKAAFWIMAATAVREAWEEIGLNPFNVEILGPLPHQPLVMFERVIYPVCGWVKNPVRWRPNWEVARMVEVPLELLLRPEAYARFRLPAARRHDGRKMSMDFPCVVVETEEGKELLWGATYRICRNFLELVFGFRPPPDDDLPLVENALLPSYIITGR